MSRASAAWAALGYPGKLALLTLGCAAVAVLVSSRHLVSAFSTPAARPPAAGAADQQRKQQYAAAIDRHLLQVDGRSLFFIPSAPPPPPPPPPPPRSDGPPPPPPPPARYGGPTIIAMLNDAVWFDNGVKLEVGESSESDSVKVVRLNAPWSAVVEWRGIEFTVDLFKKDAVVAPEPPPAAPTDPASAAAPTDERLLSASTPKATNEPPADSGKE